MNKPSHIDKQIAFAEEYISCNKNATQAYKKVYGGSLSDDTAAVNGSKLLRTTKVRAYLRRKFESLELDANYVLGNLKELAESAQQEGIRLQANIWIGKSLGLFNSDFIEKKEETSYDKAKVQDLIDRIIKSNTKDATEQ